MIEELIYVAGILKPCRDTVIVKRVTAEKHQVDTILEGYIRCDTETDYSDFKSFDLGQIRIGLGDFIEINGENDDVYVGKVLRIIPGEGENIDITDVSLKIQFYYQSA